MTLSDIEEITKIKLKDIEFKINTFKIKGKNKNNIKILYIDISIKFFGDLIFNSSINQYENFLISILEQFKSASIRRKLCIFCQHKMEEEHICNHCGSHYIKGLDNNYKETEEYKYFLNNISKQSSIDRDILDVYINKQESLSHIIDGADVIEYNNSYILAFKDKIKKYKNINYDIDYIFAHYTQKYGFEKPIKIEEFDTTRFYYLNDNFKLPFKSLLINYTEYESDPNNSYLYNTFSKLFLCFEYLERLVVPDYIDISNLNEDTLFELHNSKFDVINLPIDEINEDIYFTYPIEFVLTDSLVNNLVNMDNAIRKSKNDYLKKIDELKKYNKSLLSKEILENNINNF